jgi:hypothetical protein
MFAFVRVCSHFFTTQIVGEKAVFNARVETKFSAPRGVNQGKADQIKPKKMRTR